MNSIKEAKTFDELLDAKYGIDVFLSESIQRRRAQLQR